MKMRIFQSSRGVIFCILLVSGAAVVAGCSVRTPFVSEQLSSSFVAPLDEDQIVQTIFLIGDAGKPLLKKREPVLAALTDQASRLPDRSVILFLGDNVYPGGMPAESDDDRPEAERRLNEQVSVVTESGCTGFFIPGNHDWKNGDAIGWENIKRQNEFLNSYNNPRVRMVPRGGCPGPEVLDVGDRLRLVILDTQWWLNDGPKPMHPSSDCGADSKGEVIDSLARALNALANRYVIVAGHHPLDTHGPHGGFFSWKDHLFPLRILKPWMWIPLPLVGSAYPLARNLGVSNQDLSSSSYKEMRENIEGVLRDHPPLAYAAGHEHSIQILRGSDPYLMIVSGSGSSKHEPTLTTGTNTLFAHLHPGFVRIDISRDDNVRLSVVVPTDDDGRSKEIFSMWLGGDG